MVISERMAYDVYTKHRHNTDRWEFWGASQQLTTATHPLVRGTVSLGGGMIPLKNVMLFRR